MDLCISNFKKTFPFAQEILENIPVVCTNFRKCSAVASSLRRYLIEDTVMVILSLLEEEVFSDLLTPFDHDDLTIATVGNFLVRMTSNSHGILNRDTLIFSLRKNRTEIDKNANGHLFLGVFSDKTPKINYNDHENSLINTGIKKDEKTFFAIPCPLLIRRLAYTQIKTDIPCDQVYIFSSLVTDYYEKLSRAEKGVSETYITYKNFFGNTDAIDEFGVLQCKPPIFS